MSANTTLLEDEIIDACDYPDEAAEMIAAHRGYSFADALLLAGEVWDTSIPGPVAVLKASS